MKTLDELIIKYSRPGPRYTSYPPLPFWTGAPSTEQWFSHLLSQSSEGVDLYVHIPFCEKLCWYCGCNRIITRDHTKDEQFIQTILSEWEIYKNALGDIQVNSLHFGGGTPTFLSPAHLEKLIKGLTTNKSSSFIGSIEVDPRTCTQEHLLVTSQLGFKRISLGIQDFNPKVQKAINRYQPVELVKDLVTKIRKLGFESINFDLIYGLPLQDATSIKSTIEIVKELSPDLIAFYGYAHLPHKISNQRLIKDDSLPSATLRQELYQVGKEILLQEGFSDIGMDHFARPQNYLFRAKETKSLHRSFMGYTDKKSNCLIGLGPSSISDSGLSFIQNKKDLISYQKDIAQGELSLETGHVKTPSDHICQKHILNIMCEEETELMSELNYFPEITQELADFKADGLITLTQDYLKLTDLGKIFMRNIAMSFDEHLRKQVKQQRFSQTV